MGLLEGGYNASQISLQPLGTRIVRSLADGDDLVAKREAVLRPRVIGEFLKKFSGSPLPRPDIARNILEEMGVPAGRSEAVHTLILESAESVDLLREIKNKQYVDLTGVDVATQPEDGQSIEGDQTNEIQGDQGPEEGEPTLPASPTPIPQGTATRRVFITHGKDKSFIDPIKRLLGFGELVPVVSVEKPSVSKPVPDKVMDDMRGCGAAIIHVDAERTLLDKDAREHTVVNPNVLIEIGAAMALYGRRFILLVKDGVDLPSNLQGLYEVRYDGDSLDGDATIRLLEAINDIKNHPVPDRYHGDG